MMLIHDMLNGCLTGRYCPAEPNVGNGADYDHFSWTQTLGEVTMNVPVPAGTRGGQCIVDMSRTRLKVGVKGQEPILEGKSCKDADMVQDRGMQGHKA